MPSAHDSAPRQHASSEWTRPQPPEPGYAERSRTLLSLVSIGMLSTVSRKHAGFPFGSLMPFALDAQGRPVVLISSMAMHTQNLHQNPRCSLFVTQPAEDGDPLGAARATLLGKAAELTGEQRAAVREDYLTRHPNSRHWVDFADFRFFRLEPVDLYYVGGFGVMGWVDPAEYASASADPLMQSAPAILAHMNSDHVGSMLLLARACSGIEASEAAMTSVDRLGFTLRLKTPEGIKGQRINFPREVANAQQTRQMLMEMVQQANRPDLRS